jgi:ribonuclease P protein component
VLAATQRLRRSNEFAAAIRGGRRASRGTVVVHLSVPTALTGDLQISAEPAPAGSLGSPARAGFVVSKAVGNAVVRNRVRRRLRHLVRDRLSGLPCGTTLVVRALPAAADAPSPVLARDLDAALAAARLPRKGRPTSAGAR